jgi:plastocyanin domain-containing protein
MRTLETTGALNCRREETAACSEMVVRGDFGKSARLPEGETVPIEFLPETSGEYELTCQIGILRGKVVVEIGEASMKRLHDCSMPVEGICTGPRR